MKIVFRKVWFLLLFFLSIMKIGEEGHKAFAYAFTTIKSIRQTLKKCIFNGLSQLMATKFTSYNFNCSRCVCKRFGRRAMFSFVEFLALFKCILPHLVLDSAVLGSKFCPVCVLCSFPKHLAFHSPEPGIEFLDKLYMGGWKVHFYDVVCNFA